MIVNQPGRVTDRIWLLGRPESTVYLVEGDRESALLGGGMAAIIPDVLEQLEAFGLDEEKIRHIIIHHTHFDHVGIVPFFRKRWPLARVAASSRGKEQLARPRVWSTILALSRSLLQHYGLAHRMAEFHLGGEVLAVDRALTEGEEISLGGLTLRLLEVPGHSSCSLAVHIPEEKTLSASDAGGISCRKGILTAANSNFDRYLQSLEKMARCEVKTWLAEHNGALIGREAEDHAHNAIIAAQNTRQMIETAYARLRDEPGTTDEITDRLIEQTGVDFLPREVLLLVVGGMVRFIAKQHDADGK